MENDRDSRAPGKREPGNANPTHNTLSQNDKKRLYKILITISLTLLFLDTGFWLDSWTRCIKKSALTRGEPLPFQYKDK